MAQFRNTNDTKSKQKSLSFVVVSDLFGFIFSIPNHRMGGIGRIHCYVDFNSD